MHEILFSASGNGREKVCHRIAKTRGMSVCCRITLEFVVLMSLIILFPVLPDDGGMEEFVTHHFIMYEG